MVILFLLEVCTGFVNVDFVFVSGSTELDRLTDDVRGVDNPVLECDVVDLICGEVRETAEVFTLLDVCNLLELLVLVAEGASLGRLVDALPDDWKVL